MNDYMDRGNILWESSRLFLPEHKQALLQRKEDLKKVDKPLLDEQELDNIGFIVIESFARKSEVIVKYWKNGFFQRIIGVINHIDMNNRRISIEYNDDYELIQMDCITGVEII